MTLQSVGSARNDTSLARHSMSVMPRRAFPRRRKRRDKRSIREVLEGIPSQRLAIEIAEVSDARLGRRDVRAHRQLAANAPLAEEDESYLALRRGIREHCSGERRIPSKALACMARVFSGPGRDSSRRPKGFNVCSLEEEDVRRLGRQRLIPILAGSIAEPDLARCKIGLLVDRKSSGRRQRAIYRLAVKLAKASLVPVVLLSSMAERVVESVDALDRQMGLSKNYRLLTLANVLLPLTTSFPSVHGAYLVFTSFVLLLRAVPKLSGSHCGESADAHLTPLHMLIGYAFSSLAAVAAWLLLDFFSGSLGLFGIVASNAKEALANETNGHAVVISQIFTTYAHGITSGFHAMVSKIFSDVFLYVMRQYGEITQGDTWRSLFLRTIEASERFRLDTKSIGNLDTSMEAAAAIVKNFNETVLQTKVLQEESEGRGALLKTFFQISLGEVSKDVQGLLGAPLLKRVEGALRIGEHLSSDLLSDVKRIDQLTGQGSVGDFVMRLRETVPPTVGVSIVGELIVGKVHTWACIFGRNVARLQTPSARATEGGRGAGSL